MSKRNKLQKFADLLSFKNVYENFDPKNPELLGEGGHPQDLKGKWGAEHFKNNRPITLELACGRGEYSLGMARMFPKRNFIGVDIKGARIWQGARIAIEEGLQNVAFIRTRIEQIALFFEPHEISEIWITFPDPFPRKSKVNRRLTAPIFLEQYRKILKPGGMMHLKTDADSLFEFTKSSLLEDKKVNICFMDDDIYSRELPYEELTIKTYYERMHLADGKTIKYIRFTIH